MEPSNVAFAAPAALHRSSLLAPSLRPQTPTAAPTPACPARRSIQLSVSTSTPPRPGRRVAPHRKLQERHRSGPAAFRKASEAEAASSATTTATPAPTRTRSAPRVPLRDLTVGAQLEGTVRNIVGHGAYVDVGSTRDGLVHIRDMAIDFVHQVEDIVRPDDRVLTWVKYVDPEKGVLALSMVKPILGFENRRRLDDGLVLGARVSGIVQRITNFGAYIDIGYERLAFLHLRALWGRRQTDTLLSLHLGQSLYAQVVEIDTVKNYIKLSTRGSKGLKIDDRTSVDSVLTQYAKGATASTGAQELEANITQKKALLRVGEELDDGYDSTQLEAVEGEDEDEGQNGDAQRQLTVTEAEEEVDEFDVASQHGIDEDAVAPRSARARPFRLHSLGDDEDEDDSEDSVQDLAMENQDDFTSIAHQIMREVGEDDDDEEIDEDDDFEFANEMLFDSMTSHSGDGDGDGSSTDLSGIVHMVDDDTEFVGLDEKDIKKLKDLKQKLSNL